MDDMRDQNTPADELAIFALSRMYKRHSVIYTKNCNIGKVTGGPTIFFTEGQSLVRS